MKQKKYSAKHDKYTRARGGYSTLFNISCKKCWHEVLLYQKDGPGLLLRMYADKILAPSELKEKVSRYKTTKSAEDLACPNCGHILAAAVNYEKEDRLAFRLFVGAVRKSKCGGVFPRK